MSLSLAAKAIPMAIGNPWPKAPVEASTPGTFSEKLLHERKVELAYEGHRWPDLKRFGVAASVMSSIGVDIKGRLNLAIPQREMDINSSFTQNPGY